MTKYIYEGIISVIFLFSCFQIQAQNYQINNKWLVIIAGYKTAEKAQNEREKYDFVTTILNSENYDNLNPGWLYSVLTQNNYLVFANKYLIFNEDVNIDCIDSLLDYEYSEAYIARASIKKECIPENLKNLLNKEFIVYNQKGEFSTAKITGFYVMNVSNPHRMDTQQWQQEKLSDTEISKKLFEYGGSFFIAAIIRCKERFYSFISTHQRGE